MLNIGVALHTVLTNAYILFCFALGVWSIISVIRSQPLGGQFWGALAVNTLLAVAIFASALLLQLGGLPPDRSVYYLYCIFFVIVLPGTYALMRGRDDRVAAMLYAAITIFTGLAALTRADLLTQYHQRLPPG